MSIVVGTYSFMGTLRKVRAADLPAMQALYLEGITLRQIAERYGISAWTVHTHLLRIGTLMRKGGARRKPFRRRKCKDCGNLETAKRLFFRGLCDICLTLRKTPITGSCAHCRLAFVYVRGNRRPRKTCSRRCHLALIHEAQVRIRDTKAVADLYVTQRMSMAQIAARLGCSLQAVSTSLDSAGVSRRRHKKILGRASPWKLH